MFVYSIILSDPETWYREPISGNDSPARMARPDVTSAVAEKESYLKVYPNPAKEYFALDYNIQGTYNELRINIVDAIGKLVYSNLLQKQKKQELIDVQSCKPGLYFVNLVGDGRIIETQKISITK